MVLRALTPDVADRIAALVVGKYGTGKTSLLYTMLGFHFNTETRTWEPVPGYVPEKVCVLSAEGGLLAVRDLLKKGLVEGFEVENIHDFQTAFDALTHDPAFIERYQWVFIDSLTEISGRCEEAMAEKYPDRSQSFAMWGEYAKTMNRLVKGFRDLRNFNVVFTCLETVEKDETGKRYKAPAVYGRDLKEKLPSYFDEVLYLQLVADVNGQTVRQFVTEVMDELPAKDRSGKLDLIEPANLLHIKYKILGQEAPPHVEESIPEVPTT